MVQLPTQTWECVRGAGRGAAQAGVPAPSAGGGGDCDQDKVIAFCASKYQLLFVLHPDQIRSSVFFQSLCSC